MALTSEGTPVMASVSRSPVYGIRYLHLDGSNEMVGIAGNAQHNEITLSLALTADNRPGIAYVDDRSGDLVYAERTAQGWITDTVDTKGQVGYFPSLAFDQHNVPHISYFDNTLNDTKYAVRVGAQWRIETVDAEGQPGFHIPSGFTQLALRCEPDPENCITMHPLIAYLSYRYKPYDGELRFATRYDRGWQIETVDSAQGAGGFPQLRLDSSGLPWISYYRARTWDYHSGELRIAYYTGSQWKVDIIDRYNNAGRFSALAWSSAQYPFIAYYAARTGDLRLAWWQKTWHTQALITEGDQGGWVQLMIDSTGLAHLTYIDTIHQTTRYAVFISPGESRR